ncbi:hypothetical protein Droror1_Dr00026627 [Drosera rotundifolia]
MDSPATSSLNPNKHLKEQFVSNLSGSSMLDIFSICVIIPVLILLRREIGFGFADGSDVGSSKKQDTLAPRCRKTYAVAMALDFLLFVLPMLMFLSVLAEHVHAFAIGLTLILLLCRIVIRYGPPKRGSFPCNNSLKSNVSSYRVAMMIVTCLCILAVDFRIFPRAFAKTETYGTSLMDLGVGSFVLTNGLVSREARNISSKNWRTMLQSTFPLLLLGFGRLFSTKGVDYQVHVGEYGVHWNFFFTLAVVSILTSVINIRPQYCGILGALIISGYQICLLQGLNEYLVSDKRGRDFISQNKEGIFSIFGYWGMYLVGVQLAYHLFFQSNHTNTSRRRQQTRSKVWILPFIFWFLTFILDRHVERVSRRMCNLAYVVLVLAINFQVLGILMVSDYSDGAKLTTMEHAFDLNLLGSFLVANVLTGLVNLFVETLFVSSSQAILILIIYAFVLCSVIGVLGFYRFRFKFWLVMPVSFGGNLPTRRRFLESGA